MKSHVSSFNLPFLIMHPWFSSECVYQLITYASEDWNKFPTCFVSTVQTEIEIIFWLVYCWIFELLFGFDWFTGKTLVTRPGTLDMCLSLKNERKTQ